MLKEVTSQSPEGVRHCTPAFSLNNPVLRLMWSQSFAALAAAGTNSSSISNGTLIQPEISVLKSSATAFFC
ncbi:hypothetical protein AB6A40_009016 [Gnathostoma spinigerum]|uniref:Uncharacterized protein n=1 Tax=Gnathostoma spinigerum TaxID=75299 RepID=A0ABD6EZS5_9BILA